MTASFKATTNSFHQSTDDPGTVQHSPAALRAVHSAIPKSPLHLVSPEGRLQIHTAPYRGSFSTVLSEAIRAAGLGSRVVVAQFLRGGVNQGPSGSVQLCGRLEWLRPAIQTCITHALKETSSDPTIQESLAAVNSIWEVCLNHLIEEDLDHLVLDEIGLAISLGYLNENEVIASLENRPETMDVILTGPSIPPGLNSIADQVTELRCGF